MPFYISEIALLCMCDLGSGKMKVNCCEESLDLSYSNIDTCMTAEATESRLLPPVGARNWIVIALSKGISYSPLFLTNLASLFDPLCGSANRIEDPGPRFLAPFLCRSKRRGLE